MELLVPLHSWWRWLVLILALAAIVKAFAGWMGKQPFRQIDDRLGLLYTSAVDVQVLIGLILWIAERRWAPLFAGGMGERSVRFFSLEHPLLMLLALGLAHIGRSRSRRADSDSARHRAAAVFYTLALVLILAGIPWDRVF